jgi:hypothetical protein
VNGENLVWFDLASLACLALSLQSGEEGGEEPQKSGHALDFTQDVCSRFLQKGVKVPLLGFMFFGAAQMSTTDCTFRQITNSLNTYHVSQTAIKK